MRLRASLVAAALALAGCEQASSGFDDARADPRDAARVALGERVYLQHCASCHGARLEGQPDWRRRLANGRLPAPPHDESGHTWHHPDAMNFAMTKHGLVPPHAPPNYESDMPAFADKLSDDEIWSVLAFIKSRWTSREVREARAQMSASAAAR
ncbi:MAG: c-type cytochrome [Betaproteobacteria bacterium]|nr:c-type cytochrome [Betaproteobacteria bacterium]MDH5221301.1 c-type cytochrome [Betaproteobacteria bacterium]MDH5351928.1 c-type cytochrome [Betaproteobacteria bacterium]